ncbi:hypothetical protein LRAMOSA08847 [Lichtheimia ramosa]|uniref:Velvet domain-containing protein n=1 Tax=Lichtheimia ramosa TaxID=688394 RepID=A0A077WGJ9_9FUNG|nr:hypothetical protein LRAMOSA08847 [Lichtheimia ramosa]
MADPSYPFINISSSSSSSSTTYDRHSTIQQQQSQSLVSLEEYGLSSHITSTPNFDNTTQDITQQPPCHISSEPSFAYRDEDEDDDCHHPTASPTLMENDHSRFGYMESSQQYGNTVAGYRSNSMKLKRSDRVRAMMGAVPIDMPRLFPSNPNTTLYSSRSYHLTIVEQPLQCRACGFSTSDRRPMDPVPVVQLHVYDAQGELVNPE